jgi:hypothetical protein
MKKTSPYNFKKLVPMVMLALMPIANSCNNEDPVEAEKERLTELSNRQANAIRSALIPALTVKKDIKDFYWGIFDSNNRPPRDGAPAKDLLDSARVHKNVVDALYNAYGKPLPTSQYFDNDATVAAFYATLDPYIQTMGELAKIKGR